MLLLVIPFHQGCYRIQFIDLLEEPDCKTAMSAAKALIEKPALNSSLRAYLLLCMDGC